MSEATTTTPGPSGRRTPELRGSRILVLLDQHENRSLLVAELSREHEVIISDQDSALQQEFDLCIVDGPALDRLYDRVQARKAREQPTLLPVLLATSRPGVKMITRELWRSIDELIITPIEKPELRARVQVLLRARRLSLQVTRTAEEARLQAARLEAQTAELKNITERLAERTLAAEAANRAKSEFLAAMSHELRTPLNAITGYVDLLQLGIHGPLSDAQRDALARISTNEEHLLTLIQDVLSFAKLEAGRVEYQLQPVGALALLSGIEPLVSPQASARGISYEVVSCDSEIQLLADPERVRQILLNLVSNAVKFAPEGGWIRVACQLEDQQVALTVADNGPGIPLEMQQVIFDPFVQVERRLSRPRDGVGLGLAISRDLARGMGGDLRVHSIPGEGSTFILTLPNARSE